MSLGIAQRIEHVVGAFIRELPDTRGKVTVLYDDDGTAHHRGAVDTSRRRIDPVHSAFGYTNQDVTDLRKQLATIGVKLWWDDVEAMLIDGSSALSRGTTWTMDKKARRAYRRVWMQERRQWARENGYCTICVKNAASFRADGSQCATCKECQDKANAAKKRASKKLSKKRTVRKCAA